MDLLENLSKLTAGLEKKLHQDAPAVNMSWGAPCSATRGGASAIPVTRFFPGLPELARARRSFFFGRDRQNRRSRRLLVCTARGRKHGDDYAPPLPATISGSGAPALIDREANTTLLLN